MVVDILLLGVVIKVSFYFDGFEFFIWFKLKNEDLIGNRNWIRNAKDK